MARIKRLKDHGFNTDNRTYVIAEIGINHGGSIDTAKTLINSAAKTGADAVKFQTYISEKRAPKGAKEISDILKKHELPFKAFKELQAHSREKNIDFFSTPFDIESLEYLESIGCGMYKIASFDTVNHELLRAVAKMKKTVIISVGMSSLSEVKAAYGILKSGTENTALLHCISSYPTKEEDSDLAAIYTLQDSFDCVIGQSDHTNDITVPLYAVAAGAQIIEKHYKIDEKMECIDAPVSITEKLMRTMIDEIRRIEKIFGTEELGIREAEKGMVQFRRPSK